MPIKRSPMTTNKKMAIVRVVLAVAFFAVLCKFFYIQIFQHEEYQRKALNQQTQETTIDAKRGSILDRNGNELAVSASAYMVTMTPTMIKNDADAENIAKNLSEILDLSYDKVYKMTQQKVSYTVVARRLEEEEANLVNDFVRENTGYSSIISISEDSKRYYPHGNLLSSVLGFVGTDNQGLEGLEMSYDAYLSGTPGKRISVKTQGGTAMPFEYEKYVAAEDGNNITLTVDLEMQYVLEKYIDEARVEHNVQNRVAGIVMNVKTGEVLAMTSKPDFDPNEYLVIKDEIVLSQLKEKYTENTEEYWQAYNAMVKTLWKNKLCEQYEPGSTFKIFTLAMALEENLVSLTETFNCTGSMVVQSEVIHCAKRTGHGIETVRDGLGNSCNPVFMTLGSRIGQEKFYNYITAFGFREKTGVGIPGEQTGYHYSLSSFSDLDLATSSFGQGFKITPLQLISAVCSVANDGNYMQPYIISQITDSNGNVVLSNSPKVVRKTVSKENSDIICSYLEDAVTEHIKKAYIEGYHVAGKTGTSQKLDSKNEDGVVDKKIASFIGFAPADDPQICVLVVVDEPNSEVQYGSLIAAPLAKSILQDCLKLIGLEPDIEDSVDYQVVPEAVGMTTAEAQKTLSAKGFSSKIVGGDGEGTHQIPSSGKYLPEGATVILYTNGENPQSEVSVPNLIGMTAAECNRTLINSNLNIRIKGSGISTPGAVVISQSVPVGSPVSPATVITVEIGTKE